MQLPSRKVPSLIEICCEHIAQSEKLFLEFMSNKTPEEVRCSLGGIIFKKKSSYINSSNLLQDPKAESLNENKIEKK